MNVGSIYFLARILSDLGLVRPAPECLGLVSFEMFVRHFDVIPSPAVRNEWVRWVIERTVLGSILGTWVNLFLNLCLRKSKSISTNIVKRYFESEKGLNIQT